MGTLREILQKTGSEAGYCSYSAYRRAEGRLYGEGAFSLSELLVVAGIVMLSAMMLLPALSRADGDHGTARCKGSLRIIGQALEMYTQDYDGKLLMRDQFNRNYNALHQIGHDLMYLPARPDDVYVCPSLEPYSDPFPRGERQTYGFLYLGNEDGSAPYVEHPIPDPNYYYTRFRDICQPADYPLAADSARGAGGNNYQWMITCVRNDNYGNWNLRHGGRCNIVFADGHVESADLDRIVETYKSMFVSGFEIEEGFQDEEGNLFHATVAGGL